MRTFERKDPELEERFGGMPPWQNDEFQNDWGKAVPVSEIVDSIVVVGYEHFAGKPTLPAQVLAVFAGQAVAYNVSRTLKDPADAAEVFTAGESRTHVRDFIVTALGILEDAHRRAMPMEPVADALKARAGRLHDKAEADLNLYNDPNERNGQWCTRLWQNALQEQLGD